MPPPASPAARWINKKAAVPKDDGFVVLTADPISR
jgi:hypothetical protein